MKKTFGHIYVLMFCVFWSSFAKSQTIEPKHTVTIELGLPNGFSNPAFKSIMQGLVNFSGYYQYDFKNHLTVGGGVRYSYYTVNEFKVPSPVYGGLHSVGGFLKVGWQKFFSDRFATDLGVKVGVSRQYFDTDRNDTLGRNPLQVDGMYTEPSFGLILTADETNSYRFFASYGFFGFSFNPSMLGLQTNGGYNSSDLSKVTGTLIIGFGYTHYFKKD